MTQQQPEIQAKDIDHLGIIAGVIDQMGWVDAVNELVGTHSLEQVSTGKVRWSNDSQRFGLCGGSVVSVLSIL
jgi:hypothetical protein